MEYVQAASSDSRNDKLNDSVNNTYHIIKANPGIQRRRISELAGKSVPGTGGRVPVSQKN